MSPVALPSPHPDRDQVRARLLGWYDLNARTLPWRTLPAAGASGERADPYRVWLSEIMLQQTTTPHAAPYFHAFTERWPTVGDLAAAKDAAVMAAWAGLGYYARARNLLACARAVASEHGGVFPDTERGLRALPGVGAYTAAAVAAIAFERPANVVDGNVERVMSRLFAVETPLPAAKPELARLAGSLVGEGRPGDWAQALMDLGATVCTPKSPKCLLCPLTSDCAAYARGDQASFPRKVKKPERPHRRGIAYVAQRGGEVALVLRPATGLLGGMVGLPTTTWSEGEPAPAQPFPAPPFPANWRAAGSVEHVFTHFSLTLEVMTAEADGEVPHALWKPVEDARAALPTVFRKALDRALG
jgi:A/G-specific adenine glycosylase